MSHLGKKTGSKTIHCTHCGEVCPDQHSLKDEFWFCCEGCKLVYQLLSDHKLDGYYNALDTAFVGRKPQSKKDYSYLDDEEILNQLLEFSSDERQSFTFELPDIHCTSCIWLLENLDKLTPGIISTRVNFLKKTCSVSYDPRITRLQIIAELLHKIGYTPRFNQDMMGGAERETADRSLLYKLGVAGFSFGNIMLLSFPEYLGLNGAKDFQFLGYLNLVLALPVMLYSGSDYLKNAIRGLRIRKLGIDVPIALGMLVLFLRSTYEIISATGVGYLDSLSGFVFFLLIGRWFQQYTQQSISFDRDYRSFFPISVLKKEQDQWVNKNVREIEKGAELKIRHQEIIPCDGILKSPEAKIDYSFVTGEERVQVVPEGSLLYAGGKMKGQAILMEVTKPVNQSYLTRLWNDRENYQRMAPQMSNLIEKIGHHFVLGILMIALGTMIYWINVDITMAFNAVTAVLIIACPCVLALSVPFIYGNMLRLLAAQGVFCRNTDILERVHMMNTVVFDKTGTITDTDKMETIFTGNPLSERDRILIKSLSVESSHPLSQSIARSMPEAPALTPGMFREHIGKGIEGRIDGSDIRMGSPAFIFETPVSTEDTTVLVEIDGKYLGRYVVKQRLRKNIRTILKSLSKRCTLFLLTGDGRHDEKRMTEIFPSHSELHFDQKPIDKLKFIKRQQEKGERVMMIGDGLNDSGALKQSDLGIVVSQTTNNFTPACDIIVSRSSFEQLSRILDFVKRGRYLLYGAFFWAFLYNAVGLYFAVLGLLSPVVAAILMPVSSLTIMAYGLLSTQLLHRIQFKS